MRSGFGPKLIATFFLSLALGCGVKGSKKHFILAEKLWSDGKYSAAVAEFEKVTAQDPHGKLGIQALFRAATTETLFLSRYDDAIRKYKLFAELSGDTSQAWEARKQIGEIFFSKQENYHQAVLHYLQLINQKPNSPEIPEFYYRVGKSRFFLRLFQDALHVYSEISKKFPQTVWAEKALYETGVTYFTQGEQHPEESGPGTESYQEAIDAFQKFLKEYPKSSLVPEAKFGIASCLEELDQLDAAYHAYEALKETYPSPKVIQIKLARIKERKAQRSH